ncbi:Ser/Thr protein phosphatase family protein [Dacryopinax primogenitus]|uniref:Ser/Thr protein phosphatase family protein n=1 Tax=Dacryopinax primogenitus (strain DJM 731) TaxID=1858805 RepID=M5FVI2_DACPD|nr:Ser/Thr protein phosphatase family protein [Dacryopinax primogenitus]EJU01821.1 Ser/Thr protein phosphatase family protein [Dacryopinax primogenitus]
MALLLSLSIAATALAQTPALPPYLQTASAAFTGQPYFPSSLFAEYWPGFEPTQTSVQPQPKITDPVSGTIYPMELTDPDTIPDANPYVIPPSLLFPDAVTGPLLPNMNLFTPGSLALAAQTLQSILEITNSSQIEGTCGKCLAALGVVKMLATTAPWEVSGVIIELCNIFGYKSYGTCAEQFAVITDGQIATQVLALADVTSQDGEYLCALWLGSSCSLPAVNTLDLTGYFASPKPANAAAPPPSGKRVRVLHVSDFHLDPRYSTYSEADCSSGLCCRSCSNNLASPNTTVFPAPRYGAFLCDTPYDLAGVAVEAIPVLAGAGPTGREFDFAIFTGDLVSHDNDHQLGRAYVEYEETSIYSMMKQIIGYAPLYPTLGNHDTWPQAYNSPLSLQPEYLANQFSWDYEHISALWAQQDWIDSTAYQYASVHYGGYAYTTWRGLKIISFNTDFWYRDNWFNYLNTSDPDISGQFRWMADELQASLTAIPRIVITEIFFGHTHEDEFSIFYANNGTTMSAETAVATGWTAPSLTPLTNLSSGFRAYDIDPVTFNILDSYTWFSNVTAAPALDNQSAVGATYTFEYSAREAYGANISWPVDAPLNATWWHLVTEQWEVNPSLVEKFTIYEGKSSTYTTNCTSTACVQSKICYARSGSVPLAGLCPYGSTYGSVQ